MSHPFTFDLSPSACSGGNPSPLTTCFHFCTFREEPLSLQVLLTGDQSPASQDGQAPPHTSCPIKPAHPTPASACPPASTAAPGGSPRKPCSDLGRPLTITTDTRNHTHLRNPAPPLPPKALANPAQVAPPPGLYEPPTTPPTPASTSKQTPPISTCPSRTWSHLHQDHLDTGGPSVHPPVRTKASSDSTHSPTRWVWSSPERAAPPVERWAENVSRHRGSQRAAAAAACVAQEELSDLDCLYRTSLQAPSMHRGRGQATPPSRHKPGQKREGDLTQ